MNPSQRRSGAAALLRVDYLELLLCRTRRRASRDLLIEALWPDVPMSNANHNLDTAMSLLRNLLRTEGKESLLTTIHSGTTTIYQLPPQSVLWADVDEFLLQVTLAEQVDEKGDNSLPYFEAAWQIGNDIFLEDEIYCEWAQSRRQTINVTRHRVLHRLADLYMRKNMQARAETLLLKALEEEPTNEDALYSLMEVLNGQGRKQEALRLYQRTVDILREEQETAPGVPLQELAKRFSTEPLVSSYREQATMQRFALEDINLPPVSKDMISNEVFLYRIIKEICCWTGREGTYEILQMNIDRLIRSCDTMEQRVMGNNTSLSRRDVMTLIAGLPIFLLTHDALDKVQIVQIEEFLSTMCGQYGRLLATDARQRFSCRRAGIVEVSTNVRNAGGSTFPVSKKCCQTCNTSASVDKPHRTPSK